MFLNPLWSVLLLAAVVGLYVFVIRPRLKARFVDLYVNVDGFWSRLAARLWAFRSYVATVIAALALALPDIAVAVSPLDLSGIIGERYAPMVTAALAIYLALNRAFATKPGEDK